ncbi:LLM class flavin-dependent oxidoreductase [Streptomyces sp. NPDC049954]|uniref:LLM class flavin-dependent oxidoreductase n=1 Tax=Streptomyces sp. NPDC049954 TaxID=3155779 RepID=UPI003432BBE6
MQRTTPMGAGAGLGIFSLAGTVPGDAGSQRVRDIVDGGVLADRPGPDVFGAGEHHTPRFAAPSPAVVLAARTSSRALTGSVSVLGVLDPVRLYQDFAQLGPVSDGRTEITAVRSAYTEPFDVFGVDMEHGVAGRLLVGETSQGAREPIPTAACMSRRAEVPTSTVRPSRRWPAPTPTGSSDTSISAVCRTSALALWSPWRSSRPTPQPRFAERFRVNRQLSRNVAGAVHHPAPAGTPGRARACDFTCQ